MQQLQSQKSIRIIGLDPGLRHCGWGIIDRVGNHLIYIASGRINPIIQDEMAGRLLDLHQKLVKVFEEFQPEMAAVEQTFQNKNPDSTIKLGHARGVILLTASLSGLSVAEYSARTIKQAVVGNGAAAKTQVEAMVRILLPLSNPKDADAADALAVAICHSHHQQTNLALMMARG